MAAAGEGRTYPFKASIIMPAWNKVEFTIRCVQSVVENTPDIYEFIAVDNASADDTPRFLASLEGNVKVITNDENLGFIEACVIGAAAAEGEYLVWLNNDTEVRPGWLEALIDYADAHPEVGAVGSKLIYPDGRLQEAGGIIFSDATGWNYGKFQDADAGQYNFVRDVDYCSGAVLLIRRTAWDQVGGLDRFFKPAYYEDTDLCFSLRAAGWRVVYQPASVVVHVEGATNGTNTNTGVKRWQAVNHGKFLGKWREVLERDHWPSPPQWLKQAAMRNRHKNILVVDRLLPWFDRASGSLRTFEIVKALRAAGHHVTFVAHGGKDQERYAFALQQLGVETYAPGIGGMRTCVDKVRELVTQLRYDVAFLSFWDIAEAYAPLIRELSPATEIIVDSVDLHYVREERAAEVEQDAALRSKARDTRKRELAAYEAADTVVVVSDREKTLLEADARPSRVEVVGNIHRVRSNPPGLEGRGGLFFVGNFQHPPNADGVRWFCNEVWPLVRDRHPGLVFRVAGYQAQQSLAGEHWDGVEILGHVPQLDRELDRARVMVAPLRYGAGVKGKIGEAMSAGLPVVTTAVGAEGMGIEDGTHAFVADLPAAFADAVSRLLDDDDVWQTLRRNARELASRLLSVDEVREHAARVFGGSSDAPRWHRPAVSIVLLNWNGLAWTKQCLDSVRAHGSYPAELIVVDNGSTDGSLAYLQSLEGIRLIANADNRGFAGGVNQGLAAARGDWVVLLNNDTIVTEGWLERLVAHGETDRAIGIVGPLSNHTAGYQLVREVPYDEQSLEGLGDYAASLAAAHTGQGFAAPRAIGFCMAIRRELLQAIGGFEEQFGIGMFEDDDYSLRAQLAGFRVWIAQDAFIHHFGSRTFTNARIDTGKLIATNWEIFKRKWGLPTSLSYSGATPYDRLLSRQFDRRHDYVSLARYAAGPGEARWVA